MTALTHQEHSMAVHDSYTVELAKKHTSEVSTASTLKAVRVYLTDDTYKSVHIHPETTAKSLKDVLVEKMMLIPDDAITYAFVYTAIDGSKRIIHNDDLLWGYVFDPPALLEFTEEPSAAVKKVRVL
jgi:Ras association (RalGDS/AF-6) domain-containing protein